MRFGLSERAIINNISALAALDGVRPDGPGTWLLCPDCEEALGVVIRNEVAGVAAGLFPCVTECEVESGEDVMTLEIPSADRLGSGMGDALRRTIEEIVSLRTLAGVYRMAGLSGDVWDQKGAGLMKKARGMIEGDLLGYGSCVAGFSI